MQTVENHVSIRQKQVEDWLQQCSTVEGVCVRYGKALGGNVKVAGASLGELRKEQVLPRRYELVTAYQEKLRQVRWRVPGGFGSLLFFRFTTRNSSNS